MAEVFTEATLKFLRGLKRNNDRDWFEARRGTWEQHCKMPMLALIAEINDAMVDFAPGTVRAPQKAMMRIYRDIRFAADKRPYKTHIAAWWGPQGMAKTSGAGFYFSLSATEATFAAGLFMPDREQTLAVRRYLVEHHAEFRKIVAARRIQTLMPDFEGNPLTRPPKGFAAAGPAMDLILCRRWGVSATLPAEAALQSDLAQAVVQRFKVAAPLVEKLNAPLGTTAARPLF